MSSTCTFIPRTASSTADTFVFPPNLSRYLPESMLIERGLKSDTQVAETAKLLKNTKQFDTFLAAKDKTPADSSTFKTASTSMP